MINFLIYFYYRLTLYYRNQKDESQRRGNAYITFCFAMIVHLKTIEYFLDSFVLNGSLVEHYMSFDIYTRRFIYAPLATLPMFLIVYFYYKKHKYTINEKLRLFAQESNLENQKGKRKVIMYIIFSLFFLGLSFTSSKW